MAEELLVNDRVEAGARFLARLHERLPVAVAFWMRPADSSIWRLYVASDSVREENVGDAYAEVGRVLRELNDLAFDPYQVWLLKSDDPIAAKAKAVRNAIVRGPRAQVLKDDSFGDVPFDQVIVYPNVARVRTSD